MEVSRQELWHHRGDLPGQNDSGFYPPGCGCWDLGKRGLQGSAPCGGEQGEGGEDPDQRANKLKDLPNLQPVRPLEETASLQRGDQEGWP